MSEFQVQLLAILLQKCNNIDYKRKKADGLFFNESTIFIATTPMCRAGESIVNQSLYFGVYFPQLEVEKQFSRNKKMDGEDIRSSVYMSAFLNQQNLSPKLILLYKNDYGSVRRN